MMKACGRCGGFHPLGFKCTKGKQFNGGAERNLRNQHAWHKKAKEIKLRANNLCELCRENGVYVYDNLEVHHIHKVTDSPERLLDDSNLICLCVECHKKADKGDIPIEYLEQIALDRDREENPPCL